MAIKFLYGRRESLTGKSQAYKKSVRAYLESFGFSQTTDSFIEGTFEDMIFYNQTIEPGREFAVEIKAVNLSLKNKEFARELVKYFRLWKARDPNNRFRFMLFVQRVRNPSEWESVFSRMDNIPAVYRWCSWFNTSCRDSADPKITGIEITGMAKFLAESEVIVGDESRLEAARAEKEAISASSIARMAQNLLALVNRRRTPVMSKSILIMNIIPITVPEHYYVCGSTAQSKQEIYDALKQFTIPPFIWRRSREMMSFADFDDENPLTQVAEGTSRALETKELQMDNPTLSSQLVHIHLRRMIWNKGVYRDPDAHVFYYPMLDTNKPRRLVMGPKHRKTWVVKKYLHLKDTKYAKKGETNFFFHRSVELRTPTYWGNSFVEMTPRKYYTLDGKTPTDGETRAKIDKKFRKSKFDRSESRTRLMRLWRFVLFGSKDYVIPPEDWFEKFHFGDFVGEQVGWSPRVIGRDQTRLWDFGGGM
jgi:hypothetical protein